MVGWPATKEGARVEHSALVPREGGRVALHSHHHHKAEGQAQAVGHAQAAGAGASQGLLPRGRLGTLSQDALVLWGVHLQFGFRCLFKSSTAINIKCCCVQVCQRCWYRDSASSAAAGE